MENQTKQQPHIVILPSIGMGHLIPMIEFAKRLLSHRSFSITFVTVSGQFPASALAKLSEHPNIMSLTLPPVSTSDCPPDTKLETIISVVIKRSIEHLRKLLAKIRPISAFVFDLFCTDSLDVAAELQLPAYIFFPSTATVLSFMLYLPIIHEEIPGEYRDLKEPVKAPGCPPFRGTELVDPLQYRDKEEYWWFLHHSRRYREAAGIMVNSFDELELTAIRSLLEGRDHRGSIPPVYPIGPLVKTAKDSGCENGSSEEECLKWLDEQPHGSVLYVSFGSGGTLTQEQLAEIAWGLEMSGQSFLWVVRKPHTYAAAAYLESSRPDENEDPKSFLPEGFLERTAKVGIVVRDWAPQVKVLSHEAVGGFLSHCGWNSTLESVVYGVPMIGWPLYAEQKMNARMLADEIGVAVVVDYERGLVRREEVELAVREMMEGEVGKKLRKRVNELSGAAAAAQPQRRLWRRARVTSDSINFRRDGPLQVLMGSFVDCGPVKWGRISR